MKHVIAIVSLALVAAGGTFGIYYTQAIMPQHEAIAAIKVQLKDPYSAHFEGLHKSLNNICGYVNSKNGFGGYTGRRIFSYNLTTKKGLLYLLEDQSLGEAICAF